MEIEEKEVRIDPDWVRRNVELVRDMAGDDEAAHCQEDGLHHAVLLAISRGTATDPAECARLALTTNEIKFSRWCA